MLLHTDTHAADRRGEDVMMCGGVSTFVLFVSFGRMVVGNWADSFATSGSGAFYGIYDSTNILYMPCIQTAKSE